MSKTETVGVVDSGVAAPTISNGFDDEVRRINSEIEKLGADIDDLNIRCDDLNSDIDRVCISLKRHLEDAYDTFHDVENHISEAAYRLDLRSMATSERLDEFEEKYKSNREADKKSAFWCFIASDIAILGLLISDIAQNIGGLLG